LIASEVVPVVIYSVGVISEFQAQQDELKKENATLKDSLRKNELMSHYAVKLACMDPGSHGIGFSFVFFFCF
jgi:hypothetical protein